MTTHNRRPPYVQASLASMYEMDPTAPKVEVSVSGTDPSFLGQWQTDPRVAGVRLFTPERCCLLGALSLCARTALATRVALEPMVGEDVLLFQDDIIFAPNWYQTTCETLAWLSQTVDPAWLVLALYSSFEHSARPAEVYGKQGYGGCVAIHFGVNVLRGVVADFVGEDRLADQRVKPDDIVVREYLLRTSEAQLYAMNPSVVQHVGVVSSAAAMQYCQSPTFGRVAS